MVSNSSANMCLSGSVHGVKNNNNEKIPKENNLSCRMYLILNKAPHLHCKKRSFLQFCLNRKNLHHEFPMNQWLRNFQSLHEFTKRHLLAPFSRELNVFCFCNTRYIAPKPTKEIYMSMHITSLPILSRQMVPDE